MKSDPKNTFGAYSSCQIWENEKIILRIRYSKIKIDSVIYVRKDVHNYTVKLR